MADSEDRGLKAMKNQGRDAEVSAIAAKGGAASHSGGGRSNKKDVTTNSKGGGALDHAARVKGGKASSRD